MDFVDFDLAKKIKEKGFSWICSHYYRTKSKDLFMIFPCEDWSDIEERVYAPTISQVLNWLRKEKKIYVSVEVEREDWFEYKIVQTTKNTRCNSTRVYETYDDAMIEGIKYVLYNLI
jgi:hypothetical protein